MMAEDSANLQTDQILKFMMSAMRYRRYVMTMMPENLARQKEKIEKLYLADGSKRPPDHDLFARIGVVLTRSEATPTMGELSKALDVPLSTATRIVDGLVESGFAERVNDPDDRRIVRVTLTANGQELYGTIQRYVHERIEQVLGGLDPDERQQFTALLQKIATNLDNITK